MLKKHIRIILQLVLVIVVLIAGVLLAKHFSSLRKAPQRTESAPLGLLVRTAQVQQADVPIIIKGFGTVQPKISLQIIPQVSGRVIAVHPGLIAGGFFNADEPLITIEPADYELAVQSATAAVASAQTAYETEQAEADVARAEWQQLHPDEQPSSPLVFHEPQIREKLANIEAARAELDRARLNLERTQISLPFAGRVTEENIDVGQYVTAGAPLATVYATAIMEIPVPLEDRDLRWLDVPQSNGSDLPNGIYPTAEITATFAESNCSWTGRLVRTGGQVDTQSRMIDLIIEVDNSTIGQNPMLLPGMFVQVAMQGHTLQNVIPVPRHAVHNGNEVWLVNDDTLHITPVEVTYFGTENAYISAGMPNNSTIIISMIDAVSDGMKIRTEDQTIEAEEMPSNTDTDQ